MRIGELAALPIDGIRGAFEAARDRGARLVISAPTGSGKSTRVPVWCAARGERVLVVEPRRVACRSLARHVAELTGERLGEAVGYAVRYDAAFSERSRVVFATPGTVLRMLQPDRSREIGAFLRSWDTLILDELHERHLDTDLLLGFALALGLRELIVMSATLDATRVAAHIGGEHLEGHGRVWPVTLEHTDGPPVPSPHHLDARVHDAVQQALAREGDVLVFLPGRGEIAACEQTLRRQASLKELEILPLHGALPPEAQDRAFEPTSRRRVILATNVAETSVTLPNIGVVIDTGLVRQTRYHDGTGALRLIPIAQDSAEQRRGRAGRVRAGHCVRLWSPTARLEETTPAEILRGELTQAILTAATCGFALSALPLLDAPRPYAIEAAVRELERWNCIDVQYKITPVGAAVARLPLHPRVGRFVVAAQARGEAAAQDAVDLAAALAAGRGLWLPAEGRLSEARAEWLEARCDATALILALRFGQPSRDALRAPALAEARQIAAQLRGLLGLGEAAPRAVDRAALVAAWLEADPRSAWARRPRGHAFSNDGAEVRLGRESVIDERCDAIIVAAVHTEKDRSGHVTHTATCAIPTTLAVLAEAGLGREVFDEPRVSRRVLTCRRRRVFAGHTLLDLPDEVPRGDAAREALHTVLARGSYMRTTIERARHDIASFNLYRRVHMLRDEALDFDAWLAARIAASGVEAGDELEYLIEEDFTFTWPVALTPRDREVFERDFPLHVRPGDMAFDVEYDMARRVVTLVQTQGGRKPPPLSWLPHWGGFTIQVKRGNAISTLRG